MQTDTPRPGEAEGRDGRPPEGTDDDQGTADARHPRRPLPAARLVVDRLPRRGRAATPEKGGARLPDGQDHLPGHARLTALCNLADELVGGARIELATPAL